MTFPPEPLTTDECRRLIAACSPRCPTGLRNRALIVALWRGGLRCSEALGLHPRDLDDGVLRVRRGKGGKYRTVAVDPEAWVVLQAWLERKARVGIGGPVFSTLRGEPMQDILRPWPLQAAGQAGRHRKKVPRPRAASHICSRLGR